VSDVTVLVEAIGGPKLTIEVDRGSSVESIASAAAEAAGRSLLDEDGNPHKWRLFTPTAKGGFAPAKLDLDLGPVIEAMEGLRERGEDGGFAGPGEHEGTAYLFRVRLFVPKPVAPAPPQKDPPPIEDEEAIDLTNLNEEHDELETVRSVPAQKRKPGRRKGTGKRADGPRKRRRKKAPGEGPSTVSEPGQITPEDAASSASVEELGPTTGAPAEPTPPEAAPEPAEPTPADSAAAPASPPEDEEAHKELVAIPALAARTPVPGDTAITVPSVVDEPVPSPPPAKQPKSRPGAPSQAKSQPGTSKKARSTGIPKKARSTGIPKKARSTGIPKKARSTGIPKKARSTGIPKKARSTGIPKKARSTGIPKKARSTGIPKGAGATGAGGRGKDKGGGGMLGIALSLIVLGGLIGAVVFVMMGRETEPVADATPTPAAATPARLADQIRIDPYPTAEAADGDDPVREAIKGFNGIGARSAADLATPERTADAQASAETLIALCAETGRFDSCDAASRSSFASYLGCVGTGCAKEDAGAWFVRATDMELRALEALKGIEDKAVRGEALKLVALQSVRLGGQSMRILSAKAPNLAKLATTSCGAGAMAARPDCKGVLGK
jgi:hypothetical protein